jgi:MFS family permease
MHRYRDNAKWLTWLAPFRQLSVSAAYLTPFFLQQGLSLTQIFILQAIFSLAFLLWEIPSGLIADRFGRAFSIKLSGPISVVGLLAYGFCSHFWQFLVCELILALGSGLMSGIDTALLLDSLRADGREDEYTHLGQRINAVGFWAVLASVPLAILLVQFVSIRSTLIADGVLTGIGQVFTFKLVEAPRYSGGTKRQRLAGLVAIRELARKAEVRWLVVLGSSLSTATYIGFWLSAPYYRSLGIPVALFSVFLAVRSGVKAVLSRMVVPKKHFETSMKGYAVMAGVVYLGMATGQLWLIWVVLGHDAIQALQAIPITGRLNVHIGHEYRATLNSAVNLTQRLAFSLLGPFVGLVVDRAGLSTGLVVTGLVCSTAGIVAIVRLRMLGSFGQGR